MQKCNKFYVMRRKKSLIEKYEVNKKDRKKENLKLFQGTQNMIKMRDEESEKVILYEKGFESSGTLEIYIQDTGPGIS